MSEANVDVASLRNAQKELVAFRDETEVFWRASQYVFDSFEEDIASFRQELMQRIEESDMGRGSAAMSSGGMSELEQMLYEDRSSDNQELAEINETLERLRQLEQTYLNQRDAFIGDIRSLMQDNADTSKASQGISSLIRLLDEYLGS